MDKGWHSSTFFKLGDSRAFTKFIVYLVCVGKNGGKRKRH